MARCLSRACLCILGCGFAVGAVALPVDDAPAPRVEGTAVLPGVDPLPDHPTAVQVQAHILQLAELTDALPGNPQRDDPQAELLEVLAADHLNELVQAHENYPQLRYYLEPIIHREIARRGGPDADRLSAITLRDGSDEDDAWSYVIDIARATVAQRRVSAIDPQVAMLEDLADRHMRVLIDSVSMPELRFYALLAVRRSAAEPHKEVIIDALPDQPRLIGIVRQHGWSAEARDQLVLGLEQGVDYMPRTWVQVVVDLQDPTTYDALALHLLRARGARTYYNLMYDLPGIELDSAVHAAWETVHDSPTNARELRELSEIAVAHGHLGALEHLVSLLPDDSAAITGRDAVTRQTVLASIEFMGTNAQVRDWLDTHRDRLVFDPVGRMFYTAGQLQ